MSRTSKFILSPGSPAQDDLRRWRKRNMTRDKPYNILFLMTDQHRADHVGFLAGSRFPTPCIDRLAGSVGFSNCVSVNPICTPARTALLTGKYTHQIGTLSMSGDLSLEHPTYLRALQEAGYWTAGVGKFHWMQGWPWNTERGKGHDLVALKDEVKKYGLDYVWEVSGKQLALKNNCDYCEYLRAKGLLEVYRDHVEARGPNSMDPAKTKWTGTPWPFDEDHYVDMVTGREIQRAIDERPSDKPFFIFGSFCGPHKPYDPPVSFLDAVPDDEEEAFLPGEGEMDSQTRARLRGVRRAYKAMIACIDAQVGLIMDKLEQEGLLDSTVILFTADHGEMLGDHNRMSKMQPWRESVVVPTAIRHPEYLVAQTCDSPIEITDLTATILDIAGLDPQQALSKPWPAFHDRVPCRSLMPIVRGETGSIRNYAFSECQGGWQMVQNERWKYIRYLARSPEGAFSEELYDLFTDRHEQRNLVNDPSNAEIRKELEEYRMRVLDCTPPAQTGWAPYPDKNHL
jgi:arylsulfatase